MKFALIVVACAVCSTSIPEASRRAPLAATQATPVCIAIVLPSVQGVEGSATAVAASARDLFVSFLTGPSLQAVALDARLESQAIEEARQKQCGRVLSIALARKASGGGGGWLGRAIGQAGTGWGIPGGSVGSVVAQGATVAAIQAVSELAAGTRAKDELRLEYTLTSTDGTTALRSKADKAKARADGEDLLTPLVERAAGQIAAAVLR